jgi:hypothetical protein
MCGGFGVEDGGNAAEVTENVAKAVDDVVARIFDRRARPRLEQILPHKLLKRLQLGPHAGKRIKLRRGNGFGTRRGEQSMAELADLRQHKLELLPVDGGLVGKGFHLTDSLLQVGELIGAGHHRVAGATLIETTLPLN